MIGVIINKIPFNVPTSWYDVTYSQWQQIQNEKDELKILSVITNIPINLIEHFTTNQLNKVATLLLFMQTPIDLNAIDKPINPIDIKRCSWGKKIECEQLLKNNPNDIDGIIKCYELDIEQPIVEVYSMVLDIIEQLKAIIEREATELNVEQTREQVAAGSSMYEEFGVMNTIRSVAQGNILNYDKVLEIEYNVIFMYLKMAKTDTIFQTNYQKAISKK